MSDERDPRIENGLEGEEDGMHVEHRDRMSRVPSGRFPAVTPGRPTVGGRFTQTGMPVVPRTAAPKVPVSGGVPAQGGPAVQAGRGRVGRPGIVRAARPMIHAQEPALHQADAHPNAGLPVSEHVSPAESQPEAAPEHIDINVDMDAAVEMPAEEMDVDIDMALDEVMGGQDVSDSASSDKSESDSIDISISEDSPAEDETSADSEDASETVAAEEEHAEDAPADVDDESGASEDISASTVSADEEAVPEDSGDSSDSVDVSAVEEAVSEDSGDSSDSVDVSAVEEAVSEDSGDSSDSVDVSAVEEAVSEDSGDSSDSVDVSAVEEAVAADDGIEEDDQPVDNGPAFEILPIPSELSQESSLRDNSAYRRESRSLLRTQNWTDLVQLMENVLKYAVWADLPEVRNSILNELASIYLDKLENRDKARETYAQLLRECPANDSALDFMEDEYRHANDYKAIHKMYRRVVDVTWDGEERICYTRKAADIAKIELSDTNLAVADWEHLWEIGETGDEVQNSLMAVYRENEKWDKLASFIRERCVDWKTTQRLGLREVVEIYISGLGDANRASETLNVLMKDRPNDPLLLLQEINICRIDGDIDKLARISRVEGLDTKIAIDIHRAAAEVLWDKGERELAVQAYDSILESLPNDRDALHIKEQYYRESGHHEQLCNFYEMRADASLERSNTAEAIALLNKAAEVAEKELFDSERAVSILKRVVSLDVTDPEPHRKIIALYESLGDDEGVAEAMEALLVLTSRPSVRSELLSKLGHFYLDKLGNYEKAEDCWKKVQMLEPRNPEVSEELSRVYAKQGDYDSLDKSLTQQMRISDDDQIQQLAETKGRYLLEHNPESAHTAASWEIVLDSDPSNVDACENLGSVLEKLHRNDEMLGAWEQELGALKDLESRISLGLRIADACVDYASHTQAVGAYLRVLTWDPVQESAISALEVLCTAEERGIVQAVLETAATHCDDTQKRCEILYRSLRFIAKEDVMQRIHVMRRILILGDRSIESEFVELCRSEHHSDVLCALWLRRACETEDAAEREKLLFDVARINAEDLDNSMLAFTILFAAALDSTKAVALAAELEKLAEKTNRWEEVVAVLGTMTTRLFDDDRRKMATLKRIDILLEKLDAPARALEEYGRLIAMNPNDAELLAKIENLAQEKALQEQLLGIYGEIWDATDDTSLRAEISQKRYEIYKKVLVSDDAALTELFIGYRLMPAHELEEALIRESADSSKAALCVALLEAEKCAADVPEAADLKTVAGIYENNLANVKDAFSLYCKALTWSPSDTEILEKLTIWGQDEAHAGRYAQAVRLAAARARVENDPGTSVALYRKLADFYKNNLNDLERSVDAERTILRIEPTCIPSLEALIAWHESREEWSELRSELKQRIYAGGTDEEKIALWLRIVSISSEHLNDLESTFDGYAEILQIDETNQDAKDGIERLTGADIGADVELRRLRLELKLAADEKRPDIMLSIAKLQKDVLSLPDAACETLEQLYKETGPCGIGYEPLYHSYEQSKSWSSLVQIMLEHADKLLEQDEEDAAIVTLQQALDIVDKKLKDEKLSAAVVEKLQKIDPYNDEIIDRYCSSLRNLENWEKYAETIQSLVSAGDRGSIGKKNLLFELARIKAVALNQIDEALNTYREINRSGGVERNAYFGMATLALKKGDIDLYLNALDQVLRLLDPAWGAIFYCHMAEVCDEKDKPAQVAGYYRSARALDPENPVASDSLRSIGRRLKNWRSTSALLMVENEREMTWGQRSDMLLDRAKHAESNDEARTWLWKAIAVNHDNANAWRELAKVEKKAGNIKACYEACFGAYGTVERTTLPGPVGAKQNAELLYEVSQAASVCGHDAKSEALLRRAYAFAPTYAPVAMAIGEIEQDSGNIERAYSIYDNILNNDDIELDKATKSELLFKRGLIANIMQNNEQALDDLRATVKMTPLHYEALMTLSKTYADMKQPLFALASLQKAVLVTDNKTKRRGTIYYDMGKIWGDSFDDHDEAGIYYEGALDNGASNVDLIERSLEIYKRAGRYHEALELADTLTTTTTNPAILASLWCTKGELSESISPEQATEAYDMALSYAPGIARAFDGLERMLVARGEWAQLADLLNGRLEGDLPKEKEAEILVRLADIYNDQLDQKEKAVGILYRLLDQAPSAAVVKRLLALPQSDEEKRRVLYEKAIVYCDNCYDYALQLAQNHLAAGRDLQAWAILSPLRALLQLDPQLKETVNDLKTRFEKAESIPLDSLSKALPILSDEQFAILDAIKSIESKLKLGPASIDDVTSGASEVSENTPNGKVFAQMRVGLELDNMALYRAAELPEAIVIVNSDPMVVCIRTEIFQKAAGNELQFWIAKALGLAHPDLRYLASMPKADRKAFPKALLAAVGIGDVTPEVAVLVGKIKSALSADDLKDIHTQLTLYKEDRLLACAETFSDEMLDSSDILGAYCVADMRTVWRAESRIDDNITEQRNVKTIEDIGRAFDVSSILRKVLAYYVSGTFTEHIA